MAETPDERERRLLSDSRTWGFMEQDVFIPLPKRPMVLAGLGPPPFDVTLSNGHVRRVLYAPEPLFQGAAA